jgi:hypothetical protein
MLGVRDTPHAPPQDAARTAAAFLESLLPGPEAARTDASGQHVPSLSRSSSARGETRIDVEPGVALIIANDHPVWKRQDELAGLLRRVGATTRRSVRLQEKAKAL